MVYDSTWANIIHDVTLDCIDIHVILIHSIGSALGKARLDPW